MKEMGGFQVFRGGGGTYSAWGKKIIYQNLGIACDRDQDKDLNHLYASLLTQKSDFLSFMKCNK